MFGKNDAQEILKGIYWGEQNKTIVLRTSKLRKGSINIKPNYKIEFDLYKSTCYHTYPKNWRI